MGQPDLVHCPTCDDRGQVIELGLMRGHEDHGDVEIGVPCHACEGYSRDRPLFPSPSGKGWTADKGRMRFEDTAKQWVYWIYANGETAIVDLVKDSLRRFRSEPAFAQAFEQINRSNRRSA